MDKKINLKTLRVQMLEKETDQFQETMAYFDYMGKQVNKPVYVSKQKNANQKYYIEETKKIIAKENESGELFKYARWYLNGGHNRNKLVLGICAGLVAAAGLGVGGYFIGKTLTGGSVKVTFNANPDELHVACFDNDANKTSLTFEVAKGSKFSDIKKLANPIRHEPVDGKASIDGKVYDTLKQWELGGELVNDDYKINKNVTFDATYKRDTVTVTIFAAGNGAGYIPTGNETVGEPLTSYVRKIEYANVAKGSTLASVLRIGGTETKPEYFEPGLIGDGDVPLEDSGFRCFYDHTKGREVYETEDKKDYETYIIEDDTVLEAYYESVGREYIDSLNITFYATDPTAQNYDAYKIGQFKTENEGLTSMTIGAIIDDGTYSWNDLLDRIKIYYQPGVDDPVGTYAGFKYWTLKDGTHLEGAICDEKLFERDFSVYAYYEPDFEKDTWAMVDANAKLGVTRLINLYGEGEINKLYTLKKSVNLSIGGSVEVYVVGVGADATDNTGWISHSDETYRTLKNRTALTFQFETSVGSMPYATSTSGTSYKESNIAAYLGSENFENLIADSELKNAIVPVYKADRFDLNYSYWFGKYRFFIPSAGELDLIYPYPSLQPDYALLESGERLKYSYYNSTIYPQRNNSWVRGATTDGGIMYTGEVSGGSARLTTESDPTNAKHEIFPMFTIGTYGTI